MIEEDYQGQSEAFADSIAAPHRHDEERNAAMVEKNEFFESSPCTEFMPEQGPGIGADGVTLSSGEPAPSYDAPVSCGSAAKNAQEEWTHLPQPFFAAMQSPLSGNDQEGFVPPFPDYLLQENAVAGVAFENMLSPNFGNEVSEAFGEEADACTEAASAQEEETALAREQEGAWMIGIRLRKAGQVYFFPEQELQFRVGSQVLVELEQGVVALAQVESVTRQQSPDMRVEFPLEGKFLGAATAQDIAQHTENIILEAEAKAFCKTCIRQRELDMKLVDVEVLHDRSKIIFFFTAPSRIDFRELVKDLVRNYRTRIELRQIGVRHETQMIGALGNCGMVCCCHRYLRKFAPVTIKMAKEQNLFLNPAKLSGMCGRLLCCLSFEQSNYEEFNRHCPKLGKKYVTNSKGSVKILRANMFSQTIALLTESGEETEITLEEWEALCPQRAEGNMHEQAHSAPQETGSAEPPHAPAKKAENGETHAAPSAPPRKEHSAARMNEEGGKRHHAFSQEKKRHQGRREKEENGRRPHKRSPTHE